MEFITKFFVKLFRIKHKKVPGYLGRNASKKV